MPSSVRRIHQHWSPAGVLYRTTDAMCVVAGLAIASLEAQARWTTAEHYILAGLSAIIFYYFVAELSGMYRSWRGVSTQREIFSLLFVWIFTSFLLLGFGIRDQAHRGIFAPRIVYMVCGFARFDDLLPAGDSPVAADIADAGLQ